MDMIRLCAAFKIELRIICDKVSSELLGEAIKELGPLASKANIRIYEDIQEAVKDLIPIATTRYATQNEVEFIKLIKSYKDERIGIMIGNEYTGLSIKARKLAKHSIRIGPEVGFPMRGINVAAYLLGIIASLKLLSS